MKKIFIFVMSAIIFLCNFISIGECREFVFVINHGQTMNNSDPQRRVFEGLAWGLSNLAEDDEASVIAFNDEVSVLRPLSKMSDNPNKVFNLEYAGQSNAGDAVLAAVDMLMPKFDSEKNIIIITNGEIALGDSSQTLRSVERFHDGLRQAKWANMSVYIFNLRNTDSPLNYHSYADLAKEIPIPHTEFMTAMRTVFHNDLKVPHLKLFSQKVDVGNFSAAIPLQSFDKVKLFLVASNPGNAQLKDAGAQPDFSGKFVKIFKVTSAHTNDFEFAVNYPAGTGLTLDAAIEVDGDLQTEIAHSLFSADALEITPTYKDSSEKIFADKYFDNMPVRLEVNGEISETVMKDGKLRVELAEDTTQVSLQKIYFEDLGVKFTGKDFANINVAEKNYLIWFLAAAAILIILIMSYFLWKKNIKSVEEEKILPVEKTVEKKAEPEKIPLQKKVVEKITEVKPLAKKEEKISYDGKLSIYVTKTATDEDIEPREFNLFRVRKIITLLEVMEECRIAENFQEFENIIISPGRRGILLKNNSDCTIIKRGNLIEKNNETELYDNDAINITTSDEMSEIILRYKSLKPS